MKVRAQEVTVAAIEAVEALQLAGVVRCDALPIQGSNEWSITFLKENGEQFDVKIDVSEFLEEQDKHQNRKRIEKLKKVIIENIKTTKSFRNK